MTEFEISKHVHVHAGGIVEISLSVYPELVPSLAY